MSTTPATTTPPISYTDAEIQAAIDAAFPQAGPSYLANLDTLPDTHCWPAEAPNRLAIGKAFLAALPRPEPEPALRPLPAEASAEPEQAWATDNAKAFREFQDEIKAVWEAKDSPWTPAPGDVVRLKSGGPEMTVLYLNDGDKVKTTWFDGATPVEAVFPAACLTPAKEGQP